MRVPDLREHLDEDRLGVFKGISDSFGSLLMTISSHTNDGTFTCLCVYILSILNYAKLSVYSLVYVSTVTSLY